MTDQEGDDGIFQFGHSVGFNDEMRRTTLVEAEEIDKSSAQIHESIGLEEKVRDQASKDRSHATKELDSHLRTRKESAERLGMDIEVFGGLVNTLNNEFYMDVEFVKDGREDPDYDEDGALPARDDRSLGTMKRFSDLAMKKAESLRKKLEDIRNSLLSQFKIIESMNKDAANLENVIESQGLESSLVKSQDSTSSKLEILEVLKGRLESTRLNASSSEQRLKELEKETTALNLQLIAKQQENKSELDNTNRRLNSEIEENSRLQEILHRLQNHKLEVTNDLEALKIKEDDLGTFIRAKEETLKRLEELRLERNQLYSYKKEKEGEIAVTKTSADRAKRSLADYEKAMDEVLKSKLRNDKHEAEVTLPAQSELEELAREKQAAKTILEESSRPIEQNVARKETSRLAELRRKRENIRKDFEAKKARLDEYKSIFKAERDQTASQLDSMRAITQRAAKMLSEEKMRVDQLKARRAKRHEALRKLEVLRHGADMIHNSKQVERNLTVH